MKSRTPKIANILTIREKILNLKNQLDNLEQVQIKFSPVKPVKPTKKADKQNILCSSMTPKGTSKFSSNVLDSFKHKLSPKYNTKGDNIEVRHKVDQQEQIIDKARIRLRLDSIRDFNNKTPRILKEVNSPCPSHNSNRNSPFQRIDFRSKSRSKTKQQNNQQQIQTPRFQKDVFWQYDKKKSNPLFLEAQTYNNHRKLFTQKNQSPKNLCMSHRGSNSYMYMTPKNHQVFISTTKHPSRKNISETIANTLMAYATTSKSKSPQNKDGKKHYSKHFNQTVKDIIYRS